MKNYHGILERKPKAKAVTGLILIKRLAFVEKRAGVKDSKENQLCNNGDGQTTPYVDARYKSYENYINSMYLVAGKATEKPVEEAEKLYTELNLIKNYHADTPSGNPEEVARANRLAAEKARQNEERVAEIVKRLAEIRSFVSSVDEMLIHHIEAAGDLFGVHVSNYWRGILKASGRGEVNVEPLVIAKHYGGRKQYEDSRNDFYKKMENAISLGGGNYEE